MLAGPVRLRAVRHGCRQRCSFRHRLIRRSSARIPDSASSRETVLSPAPGRSREVRSQVPGTLLRVRLYRHPYSLVRAKPRRARSSVDGHLHPPFTPLREAALSPAPGSSSETLLGSLQLLLKATHSTREASGVVSRVRAKAQEFGRPDGIRRGMMPAGPQAKKRGVTF